MNKTESRSRNPRGLELTAERRIFLLVLGLFIIITTAFFVVMKLSHKAEASWWNNGWNYRKTIYISNSGSAQTDYQMKVLSNYDMSADVTAGKVQSDFDDLRFVSDSGQTLPYWIEDNTSSSLDVWVKIPTVNAGTNATFVVMYYGNQTASETSNGNDVFLAFDDFNDNSINSSIWTETDPTSKIDESGGKLVFSGETNSWNQGLYLTAAQARSNLALEFTYQWTSNNPSYDAFMFGWKDDGSGISYTNMVYGYYNSSTNSCTSCPVYIYEDNNSRGVKTGSWVQNTNYKVRVRMRSTGGAYYDQSTDGGSVWTNSYTTTYSTEASVHPGFVYHSGTHYVDNFLLRKTAESEPTVDSLSSEESFGPIAYWKFDEGNGTSTEDSTINNNDATISGATWQTEDQCISGKCLKLDGVDDEISLDNSVSFTGDSTIEVWMKRSSTSDFILAAGNTYVEGYWFYKQGADVYQNWGNGHVQYSGLGNSLPVNTWFHVALVRSGTTYIVYINGQEMDRETGAANTGILRSFGRLYAGVGSYANFNGYLDEIIIYKYARTASQIKADFAGKGSVKGVSARLSVDKQNSPALNDGLVGYWKMDEALGNRSDSSGNTNTLIDYATVAAGAGKFGNGADFETATEDEYLSIVSNTNTQMGGTDFTISMWVKIESVSSTGNWLINKRDNLTNAEYQVTIVNDTTDYARFGIFNNGDGNSFIGIGSTTSTPVTIGAWHFLTASFNNSTKQLSLSVDGKTPVTTIVPGYVVASSTASTTIGRANWSLTSDNLAHDGLIDEVRLYKRLLSPTEISTLYNWAPGPVAHWKMDEGTGLAANDSSGNGHTGDLGGNASWTRGKFGKGITFDGTNDNIVVTQATAFDQTTYQSFTVSTWVKTSITPSSFSELISVETDGTSQYDLLVRSTGKAFWELYDNTNNPNIESATSINDGNWHYITGVRDVTADKIYLYVDGILQGAGVTDTTTTTLDAARIKFGERTSNSNYDFNGSLDDIKIYNYARNNKQIVEDMNAGHPIGGSPVGSKLLHWKFDEGAGPTAYDSGPQSKNGTISGASWTNEGRYNKGLNFDNGVAASTVYYDDTTNSIFDLTNDFSFGAWVYRSGNPTAQARIISKGDIYLLFTTTNNYPTCYMSGLSPNSLTATTALPANAWTYVMCTYKDGVRKLYINGKLNAQDTTTGSNPTSNIDFTVGNYDIPGDNYRFRGRIDEVKLYNAALSDSEVLIDYNRGAALVLGALSDTSQLSGGSVASNSASAAYCVPGSSDPCSPPIAEWKMDEGQGQYAQDTSGTANTGILGTGTTADSADPTWTQGKIGKALSFDGTSDFVQNNTSIGAQITNGYTMSFWMKPTAPGNDGGPLGLISNAAAPTIQLRASDFRFFPDGSSSYNAGSYSLNTWSHITLVYNESYYYFYINGALVISGSDTTGVSSDTGTYFIGSIDNSQRFFKGLLDQVKIYNYARTPAQVAWDYNRGKPVGWWKLDEASGTTAYDASGNGNNGTTDGATVDSSGKINTSYSFDGADDQVGITDSVSGNLDFGTDDFSVSAWIKNSQTLASDLNIYGVANKFGSNSAPGWTLSLRGGGTYKGLLFRIGASDGLQDVVPTTNQSTLLSNGNWHHVLVIRKSGTGYLYIDGSLVGSNTASKTVSSTNNFVIGNYDQSGAYRFNGQIDDVRVYNHALTLPQVKTLYNENSAVRF